jgi:NADH-quinone oxidoreductase subunit F
MADSRATPVAVERVFSRAPVPSLADYVVLGGGRALERARAVSPAEVVAEIARSGVRGRGGAGFPTASKWQSVQRGSEPRFVVCNAAEGEPATFKDRSLLRTNPYRVLEGVLVAAHAVGAGACYVAMKASFTAERERVERAVKEMADAGWLGDLSVVLVAGPDEYLFGEEKALLEVIEGHEPLPRWLPPYLHGLFASAPQLGWESHAAVTADAGANPTLVNNVETLAHVALVMERGAAWFRELGTRESPGTVVCTVVGDVARPTVVEVPMGTPLRAVVEHAGGVPDGSVKAVFSGVANPVLTARALDTPLSYEGFEAAGSGLGAAGFAVYGERTCMVDIAAIFSRFLAVESCGQCPPCKIGSLDITRALERIRDGTGTRRDLDQIDERLRIVTDGNRCYLPVQERLLVSSILIAFGADFEAHLAGRCPAPRSDVVLPKIDDLVEGTVTYDLRQMTKRPDWTFEAGAARAGESEPSDERG